MILDNENKNPKVHNWIKQYTESGEMDIVTGYFTVGALAYLAENTNEQIKNYRFVLGDIVNFDIDKDRSLDLLNENISVEASLKLSKLAKEAVAFLELDKVTAKTLEPNFCHAKAFLYKHIENNPMKNYFITGSSNLTEAGIGLKVTNNVELNTVGAGSDANYNELVSWFNNLWHRSQAHEYKTLISDDGKTVKIPFKQYLIDEIKKIFIEYTPKELYYKVLFELFGLELTAEKDDINLNRQIGRLENSVIYNSLYEFQQKGVLSLIKMLQKYNGAILADAVGLGKTWSALAVMKFFQMQGFETILLCPKKLHHNWNCYKKHHNSKFEKDGFDFFIRFHTDLCSELLERYTDRDDKLFVNDKPKLFVIDESHNLRNEKSQRYKFLVEEILAKNYNTKVLMLSATPINNSLVDIRNQFKLITAGKVDGFEATLDIKNIDYAFRTAQIAFNKWTQDSSSGIGEFIKKLPAQFFHLTDSLTVARTRKMIEGHQNGLTFPKKDKPDNIFITPKQIGNFESFEELIEDFPPMLSGYQPAYYIKQDEKVGKLQDEKQRDRFLAKMIYILMVKRLESSWYSFYTTVDKILKHHQSVLDNIKEYQKTKKKLFINCNSSIKDAGIESILEQLSLGKREISLAEIEANGNIENYKNDLKVDIAALEKILNNLTKFNNNIAKELKTPKNHNSDDDKLATLIDRINKKRQIGANNNNQKVLIFTVYKDTAFYLFDQLKARGFNNVATVSGDISKVWDSENESKAFEHILERFAPYTKLFKEKEWKFEPSDTRLTDLEKFAEWKAWIFKNDHNTQGKLDNPIDILIATDALSEGQNLQDCDFVVNYDIHWNPVRVIQRFGRIDRLGSPNEIIFGVNFWPSNNINTYLNLQNRIEQRMTAMKLAGSEVHAEFSDTFKEMSADESLEQKQNAKMLEQMQTTLDDIDTDKNLGFDNLSLEGFRQELFEELKINEKFYKQMPKGVYTGFKALDALCPQSGIIALMGYPCRSSKSESFKYKGYELIYIDKNGEAVYLNQKEVLDALAIHKEEPRSVSSAIDQGEPTAIRELSEALGGWFKKQTVSEDIMADGSIKETVGVKTLDLINKIKSGSKEALIKVKSEGLTKEKYSKDNFDLITWFVVS